AEDGIRDYHVTGVQTCALPISLDLLKNVNISAGGILPMCQDTGTAIVMGKKSEGVLTGVDDAEWISRGVFDAYTKLNLRYSQLAPVTMWDEKNTGTDRKSTRLNSSHVKISYAVFCL